MSAQHTPVRRTSQRAVLLTDLERDLVAGALTTLKLEIGGGNGIDNRAAIFAKSFTCRRIDEVLKLFTDASVQGGVS